MGGWPPGGCAAAALLAGPYLPLPIHGTLKFENTVPMKLAATGRNATSCRGAARVNVHSPAAPASQTAAAEKTSWHSSRKVGAGSATMATLLMTKREPEMRV